MAVFLNAVHLAPEVIAAVRTRFGVGGDGNSSGGDGGIRSQPATVVWLGPAGLVQDITAAADTSAPATLTGFPVRCNTSMNASLAMRFAGAAGFGQLPPYDPVGGCRPSPACFVDQVTNTRIICFDIIYL